MVRSGQCCAIAGQARYDVKRFTCGACYGEVYFDSTQCVHCGRRLGFDAATFEMLAVEPAQAEGMWESGGAGQFRFCANAELQACNWLVAPDANEAYCKACRHNATVPALDDPANLRNWQNLERAKHQLFYALLSLNLPLVTRQEAPGTGLVFEFLADQPGLDGEVERVTTGHDNGRITINIAEGDDAERERARAAMHEPYRTLIGHFRHEIGHYFWDRLVADGGNLETFRELFGDERADYGQSLERHYAEGPPEDWRDSFISAYATAHPWEDFAETWAHYLHMVDALETAFAYRLRVSAPGSAEIQPAFEPYRAHSARQLAESWVPVTIAINAINRSMGQPDLYPFVLPGPAIEKLEFIHQMVQGHQIVHGHGTVHGSQS